MFKKIIIKIKKLFCIHCFEDKRAKTIYKQIKPEDSEDF